MVETDKGTLIQITHVVPAVHVLDDPTKQLDSARIALSLPSKEKEKEKNEEDMMEWN